jgi:DNA polymerase delta subunit 1
MGAVFRDLVAHETTGAWSKMAPFRVLSMDIECQGRKGCFPEAEKDAVIQIATTVQQVGSQEPCLRHVLTLNSCSPIGAAQVESFDCETAMLCRCCPHIAHLSLPSARFPCPAPEWHLCACTRVHASRHSTAVAWCRWQQLLRAVDADIMIGYNILNFDFPYLVKRAQTLKIPAFMHWGRIRGTALQMRDAQFSSKAYGTHAYKDITIEGRIQFDLLTAIQRDHKLSSYSLNNVSSHFLGAHNIESLACATCPARALHLPGS